MTELGRTYSGRVRKGRSDALRSFCKGCDQRITTGNPRSTGNWPGALSLTKYQVDLLLQAASEYAELCAEVGEPADPVAYVDWMSIDALRPSGYPLIVEHDGAPGTRDNRHPFPLPQAGRLTR